MEKEKKVAYRQPTAERSAKGNEANRLCMEMTVQQGYNISSPAWGISQISIKEYYQKTQFPMMSRQWPPSTKEAPGFTVMTTARSASPVALPELAILEVIPFYNIISTPTCAGPIDTVDDGGNESNWNRTYLLSLLVSQEEQSTTSPWDVHCVTSRKRLWGGTSGRLGNLCCLFL